MDTAKVRLRSPEHYDACGNLLVPGPARLVRGAYLLPQQRQYLDTMCCDCQGTWELDDEVRSTSRPETRAFTTARRARTRSAHRQGEIPGAAARGQRATARTPASKRPEPGSTACDA